ncbi:hypothetical protein KY290_027471 [Solanum tuberosum]|uniref:Uncharacterized protein n=1 Tax=Solanum tuberosum TaxID=4113 RepID=A0ABQ7UGV4_SOLTU|nr:hypothetical protein KY285_026399 [Solanum tuberosum]KAH0748239.1 hypothetical protein KY290_027471 [Solanum tuberosum]
MRGAGRMSWPRPIYGEYTDQHKDYRAPATPQNRKILAQNQQEADQHTLGISNEDPLTETNNQGQLQHGIEGKHNTDIQQGKEEVNCQTPQNIKVTWEAPDKPPNNKSQARLRKKRRDAIKKRHQMERGTENGQQRHKENEEEFDDYGVHNS